MQDTKKKEARPRDSAFAYGTAVSISRLPVEIISQDFGGRAFEVLQYMEEAEFLLSLSLANLIKENRYAVNKSINSLWYAGLIRWISVSGNNAIFKIYMTVDSRPPKDPNEACRLATLSLFYALAKKEVPGFGWRLIRSKDTPVMAEMSYINRETKELSKMIIDAPRRGEKPHPDAQLIIFPTDDEAKALMAGTKQTKQITSDLRLLDNDGTPLHERMLLF
ncbi:hypothetical protein P378_19980 [Desulforamulus profundi]|uniref:Uncharacterized protein n=2 Tax=Desulforamulus profundi TaxID=1383067 RepID=A0A2C6L1F0_9FIRM|nr:hypothetical protein P378_19980 [Desulforamulus profundi]